MKQKFVFTLLFALFASLVMAQTVKLEGNVADETNGDPLIGASILQKGTSNGTITDFDGNFSLQVAKGATLVISYVGYDSKEIVVGEQNSLKITLSADSKNLEEVVVVGYGTQRVKDMTAPVASVKGEDLSKQVASNPMSALQGKMTGVQVTNSGSPGSSPSVRIRGVGSIGDYDKPLYVVDGVFVDNIDFLSSSDIEDLTVLKDASAASIYGVRAANGVVLVTTKKGKMDQVNINFETYAGVQLATNVMKMANKDQYVELLNLANQNTTGYLPKDPNAYPTSTNWYNELLRPALIDNVSLDISGATEKTNYSVGVNYFYQEGIMKATNDYQRMNFRGRLDQKANNWLTVGFSTVLSNYTINNANTNAFFQAFVNPPVYGVYDENNTQAYPEKFASPQQWGFSNSYANPVAAAYYNNNREKGNKWIFSTYAEIAFMKNLKFKTSYNLDFQFYQQRNYTPEYLVGGSQGVNQSQLSKTYGYRTKHIIDNTLTYNNQIEENNFSVMLGQSTRIEQDGYLTGVAQDVPYFDEQSLYLNTGSYKDRNAFDGAGRYNGLSFFARGTYNYNDRYLATLTFRADGSSKYQEKWGYFPSVGLGWIISNESFMQSQSAFQNLKFRASWGLLGNDNIPANSAVILGSTGVGSSGAFGDEIIDGQGAQTVLQNYLKWEVVSEFNAGFDFAMVDNKLRGELDYYNRTTYNAVFYAPIATGGGVAELLANNGTVRNQGVELSLNWSDKVNKDFSYSIGFNLTTINNKVLKLIGRDYIPGGSVRGNYSTRTQVGYPIGSFWGYEIDGVYASEGEALRDPVQQTIKDAGYFKYRDQDGNKVIDENDKTYLGSPIPWLMGGIDFGFNYKGLDFSLTLQGQAGNKVMNAKRMNRDVFADGNYDLDFYTNAWRSDNKSTTYPSPEAYNSGFIQQANTFFVEDASYIRIQNVQVGYNFSSIKGMKGIRVYLSAQRPFSFFTYKGFTPEVGGSPISNGIDTSVYPMQSVYSVGLNLYF